MTDTTSVNSTTVNTVLGPVPAADLGVVSVHEALLSVVPGAEHAYDITIDRAEIFETLPAKLTAFQRAGGGTIVDSTGMFHGRDVKLSRPCSRATGVHVVASTGMGPEEMLGGYFLTPQTNPPTPWPAEKFADLFAKEVTEGMVVPRVERRGAAGLVDHRRRRAEGMTATDESLFRGAARPRWPPASRSRSASARTPIHDLEIVLDEGLPPTAWSSAAWTAADAVAAGAALEVAGRGAYVAIDHVGCDDAVHLTDAERADLVLELVAAGHRPRILLSSDAIGWQGAPGPRSAVRPRRCPVRPAPEAPRASATATSSGSGQQPARPPDAGAERVREHES